MATDKRTILAVDDNKQNLMLLAHLLTSAPVTLETAQNGEQAVLLCRKKAYDLLLLDYLMPTMNGLETMRRIRDDKMGLNRDTAAVMMTADELKDEALCLQKPFTAERLDEILNRCLGISIRGSAATDTNAKSGSWMAELEKSGICASDGLRYSDGDADFYRSLLLLFSDANAIASKEKKLEGAKENLNILVTQAHAIKGEARGIGAGKLGELFFELELAAKENDIIKIEKTFPIAMEEWRRIANVIRNAL